MKNKKTKILVFLSLSIFIIFSILEIYRCPFKILFGIACPTCGITRAIISVIQLDFNKAFHYHLFWPIVVVGFIIFGLNYFKIIRVNKKILLISAYIICFLNLVYYIYRLFNGSEIVYFDFTESLIYKILK